MNEEHPNQGHICAESHSGLFASVAEVANWMEDVLGLAIRHVRGRQKAENDRSSGNSFLSGILGSPAGKKTQSARGQLMEMLQNDQRRKKAVFWLMTVGGVTSIVIGVVSIAILAVAGLCLLVTGIGCLLVGKHLLHYAKIWRQQHLPDYGTK